MSDPTEGFFVSDLIGDIDELVPYLINDTAHELLGRVRERVCSLKAARPLREHLIDILALERDDARAEMERLTAERDEARAWGIEQRSLRRGYQFRGGEYIPDLPAPWEEQS